MGREFLTRAGRLARALATGLARALATGLAISGIMLLMATGVRAEDRPNPHLAVALGSVVSSHSHFTSFSALSSLGGRLDRSGWVLRGEIGLGRYDLSAGGSAGKRTVSLMAGYRFIGQDSVITALAGGALEQHEAPAVAAHRGTFAGVAGRLEVWRRLSDATDVFASLEASSAAPSLAFYLHPAYSFDARWSVGPELSLAGDGISEGRFGLSAKYRSGALVLQASSGLALDFDDETRGAYGGLSLYRLF